MDLLTILQLSGGLAVTIVGSQILVRGAAGLAAAVGVSPLVIGLTVVAFGTSSPELAISIVANLNGQPDISLGNVVGSNMVNVLLILGLSALAAPLAIDRQLLRVDVPLMILASFAVLAFGWDGVISRWESALLLTGLAAYTYASIRTSRRKSPLAEAAYEVELEETIGRFSYRTTALQIGLIVAGLALLILGSRAFVTGAVNVARYFGISELVIGLTIVAVGTSLPELATSVVASLRGERDIAVGNIVGSNLFNILAVLGATGIVASGGIPVSPAALAFDIPVMIGVAVACFPIFITGREITRLEGIVFLAYYGAYATYLILEATRHDAFNTFRWTMAAFVLPFTLLALLIGLVRTLRAERQAA